MEDEPVVVWLTEERHLAILIKRYAYHSLIKYTRDGTDYEVLITNDDYEYWDEHDYEQE